MDKLGASSYYIRESSHATDSSPKFSEYYNDNLIERVYKLFQIDFETFCYNKKAPV